MAEWNQSGGAPLAEFAALERERASLDREAARLDSARRSLNQKIDALNALGDRTNEVIENFNENVETFNDTFATGEAFTQGLYVEDAQGSRVEIYTFTSREELVEVLAHELGHALALEHVDNAASIMHYRYGGQETRLTNEDLAEFTRVCEEERTKSIIETIRQQANVLLGV